MVVKWLRLHIPNAGGLVQSLVKITRSHVLQLRVHMPGRPEWLSGKESACQCRRHGFDP